MVSGGDSGSIFQVGGWAEFCKSRVARVANHFASYSVPRPASRAPKPLVHVTVSSVFFM